jgi:hypothetical protein
MPRAVGTFHRDVVDEVLGRRRLAEGRPGPELKRPLAGRFKTEISNIIADIAASALPDPLQLPDFSWWVTDQRQLTPDTSGWTNWWRESSRWMPWPL